MLHITNMAQEAISKCKDCGEEIIWIRTELGRFVPFNLSGTIHVCPAKK